MIRAVLVLTVLASLAVHGTSQNRPAGRLIADKPTIYLEYVCQDRDNIYLRMYNNTTWHIDITTDEACFSKRPITLQNGIKTYALANDKQLPLRYRIEGFAAPGENVKVPKLTEPDNGFSGWIASQDSVLFSVPARYLNRDLQVVVRFNYEWEVTKEGYTINDPEHRVALRGIDIQRISRTSCDHSH